MVKHEGRKVKQAGVRTSWIVLEATYEQKQAGIYSFLSSIANYVDVTRLFLKQKKHEIRPQWLRIHTPKYFCPKCN
jgi:hypothetical protein